MRTQLILILLALLLPMAGGAQRHEIYDEGVLSLQVVAGQDWQSLPVMTLGGSGNKTINIGFDDLSHSYRRFAYVVEHCEADWSVSEGLFASDYIEGFANGNTIDDYAESQGTNVLYTHYSLQLPNDRCRLTMSGNYRLTVFDEDNGNRPVLQACFMVVEPQASVSIAVTTNTDIDVNRSHQQVAMSLSYGSLMVSDPMAQIKTVVMQNGRWDNARINARPQYTLADGLRWEHCRDLIFAAGNEYHKYEMLDVTHPTMGIDRIEWDGADYHVYPFACEPRLNYVYDVDADGAFYIRNSDNYENDIASEYVFVHYVLKCQPVKGDVYLNGAWTYDRLTADCLMEYDYAEECYRATMVQKLGYYNYQFLLVDPNGTTRTMPTEGDYYETENRYQALVYYRSPTDRTDRLVAYGEVKTR